MGSLHAPVWTAIRREGRFHSACTPGCGVPRSTADQRTSSSCTATHAVPALGSQLNSGSWARRFFPWWRHGLGASAVLRVCCTAEHPQDPPRRNASEQATCQVWPRPLATFSPPPPRFPATPSPRRRDLREESHLGAVD